MNWINILDTGLIEGFVYSLCVIGLAVAFRLFKFPDLTIDGSFALGAAVCAACIVTGKYSLGIYLPLVLLMGGLAGIVTALLHLQLKINKFLAGIIVVTGLYSIILRILGGGNISIVQSNSLFDGSIVRKLNQYAELHIGTIGLLFLLVGLIVIFLLYFLGSKRGLEMRAASSNPVYAKTIGLSTFWSLVLGLFLTNSLAALSGALFVMKNGFADIGLGQGMLITSLAAMIIGEKILPNKRLATHYFVVLAALLGSVLYQLLWAVALQLNFETSDLKLLSAVLVIALFLLRTNNENYLTDE